MGLAFDFFALGDFVVPVHYEVAKLVGSIEAAVLSRFLGVEENEGLVQPQREGIDLSAFLGEREDPNTVRLEKVDHVRDRLLAETPLCANNLGRRLRIYARSYARDGGLGQLEPR